MGIKIRNSYGIDLTMRNTKEKKSIAVRQTRKLQVCAVKFHFSHCNCYVFHKRKVSFSRGKLVSVLQFPSCSLGQLLQKPYFQSISNRV